MAYTVEQHKAVFFTVGRERPIAKIVLHWMATNLAGCDATFAAGVRQASAHYGLEDDKRHQYVKESDTAWHAGNRTINHESIGIEHSAQPGRAASEGTIANSIDLCTSLCREYGLTADDIHVHNEYYATQCPGTLPVSRIREAVRANLTTAVEEIPMAIADDILAEIKALRQEEKDRYAVDTGRYGDLVRRLVAIDADPEVDSAALAKEVAAALPADLAQRLATEFAKRLEA